MAISAYILKTVENDPFLRLQMRAKEMFNRRYYYFSIVMSLYMYFIKKPMTAVSNTITRLIFECLHWINLVALPVKQEPRKPVMLEEYFALNMFAV